MKDEYGRSLIEMLGILAIGAIMTVTAYETYNVLRTRQNRTLALTEIEQIARNTKILLEMRGDYSGVSVDYLIKAGALTDNHAPLGDENWSITSGFNGETFSINLTNLTETDCAFFATKKITWAKTVVVNGIENGRAESCLSAPRNLISFVVK